MNNIRKKMKSQYSYFLIIVVFPVNAIKILEKIITLIEELIKRYTLSK